MVCGDCRPFCAEALSLSLLIVDAGTPASAVTVLVPAGAVTRRGGTDGFAVGPDGLTDVNIERPSLKSHRSMGTGPHDFRTGRSRPLTADAIAKPRNGGTAFPTCFSCWYSLP